MMNKGLYKGLCEVIGKIDLEIHRTNVYDEPLSVEDATQILSELEDNLTDLVYKYFDK